MCIAALLTVKFREVHGYQRTYTGGRYQSIIGELVLGAHIPIHALIEVQNGT